MPASLVEDGRRRRRFTHVQAREQLGRLVARERGHRDRLEVLVEVRRAEGGEVGRPIVLRPHRGDDEAARRRCGEERLEQRNAVVVGPLEVIEGEDEGRLVGDLPEEAFELVEGLSARERGSRGPRRRRRGRPGGTRRRTGNVMVRK